jgi:HD-like signal output (HDOD) protein
MPKSLKNIVMDMRSLEAFPKVATSVLSIANQPGVVPADVIDVVQTDAGITGKVLKLCNSAYYGFQREVGSLKEAGNMLGTDTLVNLVLTSSANKFFRNTGQVTPQRQEELWTSSITQALAARLIAQRFGYENPDRAYTAGLMQNIGTLVMDRFFTDELSHVQAEVQAGRSALSAERAVLGIHHAEIGARLATKWELPESLTDTIRFHHDPANATVDPLLTSTVHLAETMLDQREDGDHQTLIPHEVCEAAFELTGLGPEDFKHLEVVLADELLKAQDLFAA